MYSVKSHIQVAHKHQTLLNSTAIYLFRPGNGKHGLAAQEVCITSIHIKCGEKRLYIIFAVIQLSCQIHQH